MQLTDFLKTVQETPDIPGLSLVRFYSQECPSYFLAQVFRILHAATGCTALDSFAYKVSDLKAQLETSFLGMRQLYWLKNAEHLDAASRKAWLSYISTYTGPHCVLLWTQAKQHENDIELPEHIDRKLYKVLYAFLYPGQPYDDSFAIKAFEMCPMLTLDEACILMGYQTVLGRNADAFFAQWFSKIITPEKSLFTLSQHLYARHPKFFFEQWKHIKEEFPHEFWIAYWSEQAWQGALFIMRARAQGYEVAKKAAYRLPFSFMNKDWQKYSHETLIQAHDFLYKLDFNAKNGSQGDWLELWFMRYFLAA